MATYTAPLRWGIIGCGNVTEVKSGPAYQQTEGFELHGVMRRDAEKLADYARRHGVPKTYPDAQALIDDPEIDAVYIATPPDSHREYGVRVAAAGKPCCIEKPLASSYADSRAIHEAFDRAGVPLFVAYYRRTLPRFAQVRAWLEQERIGQPRHVSWTLVRPPSARDLSWETQWRTDARVAPGGHFDDLASHGLDLIAHLLGELAEVGGTSLNQQQLYSAKDAFAAHWRHTSGVTGSGTWNFGTYADFDRVEIFGSAGTIRFSVFDEEPVRLLTESGEETQAIDHPATVQLPHVRAMRRQLLDGDYVHPASGEAGLHASWIMSRILGE